MYKYMIARILGIHLILKKYFTNTSTKRGETDYTRNI